MRPDTVLPGIAPDVLVLARAEDTVVALGDLRAYPNGFQVVVTAVVRALPSSRRTLGSGTRHHRGSWPLPDDFLRFGFRYADGTVLTNLDPGRPGPDEEGPRLVPESGSGSMRRHEQTYWVWPLPPPGRLDVVCEWPARGIPETTVELDAGLVLSAAQRAMTIF